MRKIKLKLVLPVFYFKEGKSHIAYTPALDLSTSGKTYKEAKKRFKEAVYIFVEEITKNGTFIEVIRDFA